MSQVDSPYVSAQILIQRLSDAGYKPQRVAQLMGHRISWRALYRWRRGDSQPQRDADYEAVIELAKALSIDVTRTDEEKADLSKKLAANT